MTIETIELIERLEREATPGPWMHESIYVGSVWGGLNKTCILTDGRPCDAALAAALRNSARDLCQAARDAERYRKALVDIAYRFDGNLFCGAAGQLANKALRGGA